MSNVSLYASECQQNVKVSQTGLSVFKSVAGDSTLDGKFLFQEKNDTLTMSFFKNLPLLPIFTGKIPRFILTAADQFELILPSQNNQKLSFPLQDEGVCWSEMQISC